MEPIVTTNTPAPVTSNKKVHRAWSMYDWANSTYNLVITTTFFPVYYNAVTNTEHYPKGVPFMGRYFVNTALKDYSLALAYLIIAFLSPILSSIADYKGNKKRFMQFFCYLGSLSCCGMYFFDESRIAIGIICFVLAAIGYCGSLVFYNSYLPEIALEEEQDKVSAQGFAYGYIGSVLLQLIGFGLVSLWPEKHSAEPVLITFLLVGLWWMGFAQITFKHLPKTQSLQTDKKRNVLTAGFKELRKVWKQLRELPVLKLYLAAFFLYSIGVQTVMLVAVDFGDKVLKLEATKLIITVVVIQLVAIIGAWMMSRLSAIFGNLKVLIGVVVMWMLICIYGYYLQTEMQFYIIASAVGLVMGGIQSLSRSTYSKLMPPTHDTASFFSFYDVTEKIAIVVGMFSFGFIEEITGSMRNSVLTLIGFFAAGALLLYLAINKNSKEKLNFATSNL